MGGDSRVNFQALWSAQRSLGTLASREYAIDDHGIRVNSNGGSLGPWHVRGGLPCEERPSG